jgi:hypothetical protein
MSVSPQQARILRHVIEERVRQDAQWGEQNHPDGTSPAYVRAAEIARLTTERHAADGTVTWLDIIHEELMEAASEPEKEKLRAELVQVVAVGVAWIEAIDRRKA